MRFKPPPSHDSPIGWRVEFRPLDLSLTAIENAAFVVFVVLVTRAILSFQLNFYIPMSKVSSIIERRLKIYTTRSWLHIPIDCMYIHFVYIRTISDCTMHYTHACSTNNTSYFSSVCRLRRTCSDLSSEMLSTLKSSTFVKVWYQKMRRRPKTTLHSHMTMSTQR